MTRQLAGCLVVLSLGAAACQGRPAPPRDERLAIPPTDEGLPGAGLIRRADWFRQLWVERRTDFALRQAQERGAIVVLGDSIVQGWGDDFGGHFPDCRLANRGIDGDTTRGALYRMDGDVLAARPRAVVLLIGSNDIEDGADPQTTLGNLRLMLTRLRHHDPAMPVLLCLVLPSAPSTGRPASAVRALNRRYAEVSREFPGVTLVDTWTALAGPDGNARPAELPDLIHPTARAYGTLADALRPALARLCTPEPRG